MELEGLVVLEGLIEIGLLALLFLSMLVGRQGLVDPRDSAPLAFQNLPPRGRKDDEPDADAHGEVEDEE